VYPALAVALLLLERGCDVQWVGTRRGLESRVVPARGITLHTLPVRGVRGKNPLWKLIGLFTLLGALLQALWLVLRLSPGCVIGMGGYVAGPAGVAAWLLRKPLLIHEQNAVAGTTNRLLAPLATRVFCAFAGAFPQKVNARVVGNPVREELLQRSAAAAWDYSGERPLRLLVVGGSLGSQPINVVVAAAVAALVQAEGESAVQVRHQSGEAHGESLRKAYGALLSRDVEVVTFIEDMASAYAWADLVLCRAGALTVSELAVMGRPAILVPLPHAIDDHQTHNARSLADLGAALLLPQAQLDAATLCAELRAFIADPGRLAAMAAAAAGAARRGATESICDACEELLVHG
jgi:UDP-N-acetylglucosamine--N-acetylmuramyl-(pentapeptide) pyrophosphoryl-undecaprenol N-acetylglucosamine transferase